MAAVLIVLWALLMSQVAVLRPSLDRRARLVLAGQDLPRSHQHLAYIVLEGIKVMLLPLRGILLALRLAT